MDEERELIGFKREESSLSSLTPLDAASWHCMGLRTGFLELYGIATDTVVSACLQKNKGGVPI